jgi:hypothetical protein
MKKIIVFVFIIHLFSCNTWNKYAILDISKNGVVASKYIDEFHHNEEILVFRDNTELGIFSWSKKDTSLFHFINVGDSIVKRKGEFSLFVFKPNGKVKEFKYMDGKGKVYDNKEAL